MAEPPHDSDGRVLPHDGPAILDVDRVIRYIDPGNHMTDDVDARKRISSGAFSLSSEPHRSMSVDLERPIFESGFDRLSRLPARDFGAVAFVAGTLRGIDLRVGSDPLSNNPFHGGVWDTSKRRMRKRLLKLFAVIRKPSGMD